MTASILWRSAVLEVSKLLFLIFFKNFTIFTNTLSTSRVARPSMLAFIIEIPFQSCYARTLFDCIALLQIYFLWLFVKFVNFVRLFVQLFDCVVFSILFIFSRCCPIFSLIFVHSSIFQLSWKNQFCPFVQFWFARLIDFNLVHFNRTKASQKSWSLKVSK